MRRTRLHLILLITDRRCTTPIVLGSMEEVLLEVSIVMRLLLISMTTVTMVDTHLIRIHHTLTTHTTDTRLVVVITTLIRRTLNMVVLPIRMKTMTG